MEKLTIKQIRVGLGLTQKEMARELGLSLPTYRYKESGIRKFYIDEVIKICDLANVNIDKVKI